MAKKKENEKKGSRHIEKFQKAICKTKKQNTQIYSQSHTLREYKMCV